MARTMLTSIVLATAAFSSAAPLVRKDVYHGTGLYFVTDIPGQRYTQSPGPVEINMLVNTYSAKVSAIKFDTFAVNVDINKLECRAFSDIDGVVPIGKPFNRRAPVLFSTTETVTVERIPCYVVTEDGAEEF